MRASHDTPRVLFIGGPSRLRRWLGAAATAAAGGLVIMAFSGLLRSTSAPHVVATVPPPVATVPETLPAAAPPAPPDPVTVSAPVSVQAPAGTTTARGATERASATPTPPGRLLISARPWGRVYVDEALVGNTPLSDVALVPGARRIRVVRDGFRPFERRITVAPGQMVRILDIELEPEGP